MGAEPWEYFVAYETDVQAALEKLKQREFDAGRFRYSEEQPASVAEAREIADADGTASILDIDGIGSEPDFGIVAPLPEERLVELFGTHQPTREMIEASRAWFEDLDRGQGVYMVSYQGNEPAGLYFGGYSYD